MWVGNGRIVPNHARIHLVVIAALSSRIDDKGNTTNPKMIRMAIVVSVVNV